MEINSHRSFSKLEQPLQRKEIKQPVNPEVNSGPSAGVSNATGLSSLEDELQAMPEVRPERLEEGFRLARDPEYPSSADLKELSGLILRSAEEENR